MIGYISSADERGNCKNITVTLWNADDFEIMDYDSQKEIYTVNRYSGEVCRISSAVSDKPVEISVFTKLVNMLKSREIIQKIALTLSWRVYGDGIAEIVATDYMENVWFPVSVLNDSDNSLFINVTGLFFKKAPKPLEVSLVCDMLNLVSASLAIKMSNPFVNIQNSLFCRGEALRVIKKLFGNDLMSFKCMNPLKMALKESGELNKVPMPEIKIKKILNSLNMCLGEFTRYEGNDLYFLIGAKRDCFFSIVKDMIVCIERGHSLKRFAVLFSKHISTALSRIRSLGEILVVKEHMQRLNDINYLDLYELNQAFAFNEKSLELKNTVRKSAKRQKVFNGCKIPDYISVNKEFKYI